MVEHLVLVKIQRFKILIVGLQMVGGVAGVLVLSVLNAEQERKQELVIILLLPVVELSVLVLRHNLVQNLVLLEKFVQVVMFVLMYVLLQ